MRKTLLAMLCGVAMCAAAYQAAPLQKPDAGRIDRIVLFSPQLADSLDVDVWLPEGYSEQAASYPVIYMHDGQNLFDASTTWNHQAWEIDSVATAMSRNGEITAPVVVGIHTPGDVRLSYLMPSKPLTSIFVTDDSLSDYALYNKPMGDEYAAFVTSTLMPVIEDRYNVARDAGNTSVMGSSMGGLMSLYLICEYPERFGSAACLSTHWVGDLQDRQIFPQAMISYIRHNLPDAATHRLYFDHGTGSYDEMYSPWQPQVDAICRAMGYDSQKNFLTIVEEGATHNEEAWKHRLHLPLSFLLGK